MAMRCRYRQLCPRPRLRHRLALKRFLHEVFHAWHERWHKKKRYVAASHVVAFVALDE